MKFAMLKIISLFFICPFLDALWNSDPKSILTKNVALPELEMPSFNFQNNISTILPGVDFSANVLDYFKVSIKVSGITALNSRLTVDIFIGENLRFSLKLTKSSMKIADISKVYLVYNDKIKKLMIQDDDCLFDGQFASDDENHNEIVAVSFCNGRMSGIIMTPSEVHLIHPLANTSESRSLSNLIDHVVFLMKNASDVIYNCGIPNKPWADLKDDKDFDDDINEIDVDSLPVKTIELSVFVDHILYEVYDGNVDEIVDFLFTTFNGVQQIFSQDSLMENIELKIVRIEIWAEEIDFIGESRNAERYLNAFADYQASLNPEGEEDLEHWDHAVLLSGLDLLDRTTGVSALGISFLDEMCHPVRSTSIGRGTNLLIMTIIAHEMGHNLGATHDGVGNNCLEGGIMSSAIGPQLRNYTWSSCSKMEISQFLRGSSSKTTCLDDRSF